MAEIVACAKCGRPRALGHRCPSCGDSGLPQQPADKSLGPDGYQVSVVPGVTCSRCGANLPTEARFCARCGTLLSEASPTQPALNSLAHPPRRRPWHTTLAGRLAVLAAIIVAAVVVVVVVHNERDSAEKTAPDAYSTVDDTASYEPTPYSDESVYAPTTVEQALNSGNVQIVVTRDVITLAMYESVHEGDTYAEVMRKMPRPGMTTQGEVGEPMFVLAWENSDGSAMYVAFENGVVVSKVQSGLP